MLQDGENPGSKVINLKKAKIIVLIIALCFLFAGITIQVFLNINTKQNMTDSDDKTEEKEIYDIFNASTKSELVKIAKETGIELQESEYNKNYLGAKGYKFMGQDVYLAIKYIDDQLLEFNGEVYLTPDELRGHPEALKEKCKEVLEVFTKRFHVENNYFTIRKYYEMSSVTINTDDVASYQAILDGNAKLSCFIKDKDGSIWGIRASLDDFDAVVFKVLKFMGDQTQNMYYDVDLSQATTEVQGE